MLMHRRKVFMGLFVLAGLAGCGRTAPIKNEVRGEFLGRANLTRRGEQIRAAASDLGWKTQVIGPGLIQATLDLRSHQAVVDISYDTHRFSIGYLRSTNLNYDGTSIHPNYNSWVGNLEREIISKSSQPVGN
jgi:hypothetical protein